MASEKAELRKQLRQAGFSSRAITAAWPEWWSVDAERSFSARTELRYTLARRLGVSPRSLFDGSPRFVWPDEAKFKSLGAVSRAEASILAGFGISVGRCVAAATVGDPAVLERLKAGELRASILASSGLVNLSALLAFCWAVGIPVVQLRLFPLERKRMQALTVRIGDRHVVLIGRESMFPAQIAFVLAHEVGHILLGHLFGASALLDVEDPLKRVSDDEEEVRADKFALELLTGDPSPHIEANLARFTSLELADAALAAAADQDVDPGILALCLAHATGRWRQGYGALRIMPPGPVEVGDRLNEIARNQLELDILPVESRDFLLKVIRDSE